MTAPRCTTAPCYAPVACTGWGYCRQRNYAAGVPDEETQAQWRWLDSATPTNGDTPPRTGAPTPCAQAAAIDAFADYFPAVPQAQDPNVND